MHNNLGSGWSLGFSSIEISDGKKYLHLANGNSYEINITSTAGDSNLKNYTLNDIRLENDSGSFTNGVKNSQYALFHKNGNREYFADDGRLLGIQDRFGNTIKFEHTTINNHPVINKITDSVNRVINISYQTTSTGKKVVVTAPDSTTIQYILEPISGYSGEYKLVKKIDRLGREIVFNYSVNSGNFSFFSKSSRDTANYFANLTEIHYPTGAYTKYTYESTTGNLGNQGSYVYYRIKTREDIENSVSNKKDTYTYSGNYTGYPTYSDPASLPSSFTYGTTVTDNENLQTIYTFNYKHLKTHEETKDGTTQINITDYEYDSNKLPVKIVKKDYGKTAEQYMLKAENFSYDTGNFGDLVGYWDTRPERDSNYMPLNDEHKTTYAYNSTYHYVTEKTYKKDASTTVKEEYIPYSDNKNIEWSRVKENGVLKEQTWYNYDSYGNVIEERKYLEDSTNYISQKYSYDDNEPGRNGQLNGAYLTRKWVEGVKDADGTLVEARPGNDPGVIDETFKYNIMGLVVEKTDGNGNKTSYEYDNLGRTRKEIHPDSTYREYTYNDSANSITVKDENGKQVKYNYDGFGNLAYVQDMTGGEVTREYTYDQKFRLKSEKEKSKAEYGNESTTWYTYYKDGRLSKKEIKNKSGIVVYTENYEYDDAYNSGQYARTTRTIVGDTTSPSIITHTYVDRNGQVVKEGRMNGTQELIDTFEYDYVGNKITERNARAYSEGWPETWTSRYEYDYAGRVTRTYNISGDYSSTEYDALGRVKAVTDIKGNKAAQKYSTLYFYDNLGRLVEERVPFEDISGTIYYSIKKYYYDRNGNVVMEKESRNKPGEADSYNQTEYEYNNRNMLTKVITYDGGAPENYTQYYYDGVGNKLRMYTGLSSPLTIAGLDNVTPGSDNDYSVTKYEYDQFNRLVKMTDPLGRYETYIYDLNGDLRQKVDRNGSVIEMEYTALGKLFKEEVTNADDPSMNVLHEYTYYPTGNIASIEVST